MASYRQVGQRDDPYPSAEYDSRYGMDRVTDGHYAEAVGRRTTSAPP